MKKFLTAMMAAAMMFIATDSFAQFHVGLGYANSAENFKVENIKETFGYNGLFLGGGYDVNLIGGFSVDPGLYYSYLSHNDDVKHMEHMLYIPVDFKYSIEVLPILNVFAYAGPTFQFQVGQKTKVGDGDHSISTNKTTEDLSKFDILLGGGLGVDILDMIRINFGYRYGLVNLNLSEVESAKMHRGQFLLGVSYLF